MVPLEVSAETLPRKRFTRQEVDCMLKLGLFEGERYELLDGELLNKMGQNPLHALAIRLLLKWLSSFLDGDLILGQLPLEVAGEDREKSLPEPDFAVLREHMLESRHPRGDETILVIEVSNTSAAFDLSRKMRLYARAGVPEYWVLDLNRRLLVVHRENDGAQYRKIELHPEEDTVSPAGRSESVRIKDILPAE